MDVSKLAPYAKAVAAVAGSVVVTAKLASDGVITWDDTQLIVAAWGTAFTVFAVRNKKA